MKKLLFVGLLLVAFNTFGQTNVKKNYTAPHFQGSVKVEDTLGIVNKLLVDTIRGFSSSNIIILDTVTFSSNMTATKIFADTIGASDNTRQIYLDSASFIKFVEFLNKIKAEGLTINGDANISQHMAIGSAASINTDITLNINDAITSSNSVQGIQSTLIYTPTNNTRTGVGSDITIIMDGAVGGSDVMGANISATNAVTAGTSPNLIGLRLQIAISPGAIAPSDTRALEILGPVFIGADPTNLEGINIANQGNAGVTTSTAINIEDQSGSDIDNFAIRTGTGLVEFGGDLHLLNDNGLVVGHTAQIAFGEVTAEAQILGTTETDATLAIGLWSVSGGFSPIIKFMKSMSAAIGVGNFVTVANSEQLGMIQAYGADGTDLNTLVAEIQFNVDDPSVAAGQIGGEIVLKTATSAGLLASAITINNLQQVGIGITGISPVTNLHILEANTDTVPSVFLEQLGTGDAALQFSTFEHAYAMGIDNSDDDKFKISHFAVQGGAVLGTEDLLVIDPSGNMTVTGQITTTQLNSDNLRLDGNTISSEDVNGIINIIPNGIGRTEVIVTPGTVIGGFASGGFHVTSPSASENANSVITGHSSFGGNKQLWYFGSVSSSNDNIAFINRQNGSLSFSTNSISRMVIGADGLVTINNNIVIEGAVSIGDTVGFVLSSGAVTIVNKSNVILDTEGAVALDTATTLTGVIGQIVYISTRNSGRDIRFLDSGNFSLGAERILNDVADVLVLKATSTTIWKEISFSDNN